MQSATQNPVRLIPNQFAQAVRKETVKIRQGGLADTCVTAEIGGKIGPHAVGLLLPYVITLFDRETERCNKHVIGPWLAYGVNIILLVAGRHEIYRKEYGNERQQDEKVSVALYELSFIIH